jgi:putative transposase
MAYHSDSHRRRSIRLPGYDYSQDGAYFVTICAYGRECVFGNITDDEMFLNTLGCIVSEEWERTSLIRPSVELDEYVVMPNHIHGIIVIHRINVGATRRVAQPPEAARSGPMPDSIGAIVGQFKSMAAKRINRVRQTPGASVWHRNYYERIVRDETSLNAIRQYILSNPAQWMTDHENPAVHAKNHPIP